MWSSSLLLYSTFFHLDSLFGNTSVVNVSKYIACNWAGYCYEVHSQEYNRPEEHTHHATPDTRSYFQKQKVPHTSLCCSKSSGGQTPFGAVFYYGNLSGTWCSIRIQPWNPFARWLPSLLHRRTLTATIMPPTEYLKARPIISLPKPMCKACGWFEQGMSISVIHCWLS